MISGPQKDEYWTARKAGFSIAAAAKKAGFSESTGNRIEKNKPANGKAFLTFKEERGLTSPKETFQLCVEAQMALDSFDYFRVRYLGRTSTPWQVNAAEQVVEWLKSDQTEFVCMNMPPGSGKTTLWSDIVTWLICRERTLRVIWMSHTLRLAAQPVNRVRKVLERTRPLQDAQACLAVDFGRFRPEMQDIWRREEFTVMALDGESPEDKEPTVAAYGMDSEFLGHRGNLVVGDDLVTGKLLRSQESIENQQKWWSEEGETRAEPGGCVVLNGQRMGAEDIYRFSLDQKLEDTDAPKYRHVVFPAHFEDQCQGHHGQDAPAWPEGCLLDPVRLPWSGPGGLLTKQTNRSEVYRVQYQQEDVDPAGVLVPMLWIEGGRDSEGFEYPGCWDTHRGIAELPRGLSSPYFSIASADPSPTKQWAIGWWIYHPASNQHFLMDLIRQQMDAPDFLDWNANGKNFFGVMEDWQVRSKRLGVPIETWIVEQNAAQRFLLQYDHVKRWQRLHKVEILGHNTTAHNKLDPLYGIQSIANEFRFGNIRLPGKNSRVDGVKDLSRTVSMKLIDEATRYPDVRTDDTLMQTWFYLFNLPTLARDRKPAAKLAVPKFLKSRVAA